MNPIYLVNASVAHYAQFIYNIGSIQDKEHNRGAWEGINFMSQAIEPSKKYQDDKIENRKIN